MNSKKRKDVVSPLLEKGLNLLGGELSSQSDIFIPLKDLFQEDLGVIGFEALTFEKRKGVSLNAVFSTSENYLGQFGPDIEKILVEEDPSKGVHQLVVFHENLDGNGITLLSAGLYNKKPLYLLLIYKPEKKQVIQEALTEGFFQLVRRTFDYVDTKTSVETFHLLAHTDDVTGLYNQRRLYGDLEELIEESKTGQSFCVLFIDIDDFKKVNDGHGHLTGSELLIEMAKTLKDCLRETDLMYRYGGDEFVVILPETQASDAKVVSERLLDFIKKQSFDISSGSHSLSVSIGLAEYPSDADSAKDIIAMADDMMYNSKKSGRGKVISTKEFKKKK